MPPKLAAPVRLLDNDRTDKTDFPRRHSTAIVALRNRRLRHVSLEDHTAVLCVCWPKRHRDLIAARTRAICRLHTTVCFLIEGHLPRRLQAEPAAKNLATIHPTTAVDMERKALARDLLRRGAAASTASSPTTSTASATPSTPLGAAADPLDTAYSVRLTFVGACTHLSVVRTELGDRISSSH